MKIQIDYASGADNVRQVADGLTTLFGDADLYDLSKYDPPADADVYLIGFNLGNNMIPYRIMEFLETLEEKTVMFFVTSPVHLDERVSDALAEKFEVFVSDSCQYLGVCLCDDESVEETIQNAYLNIKNALEEAESEK